jgi:hypothetical protein
MTGLKTWIKIWHEKEINADENRDVAFNDVQSFVQNKFHKDNNPQLTDGGMEMHSPTVLPSVDRKAIERLEILIDECKTFEELSPLFPEAIKLKLEQTFGNKLNQLKNI